MTRFLAFVFAGPIQIFVAIAIVLGAYTILRGEDMLPLLVERLETEEAFRANPYQDTLGHETIGYGTKLPITEAEGAWLLGTRLADTHARLMKAWAPYGGLSHARQGALLDMAYELGVEGLLEFHDMLAALERGDWAAASTAALDSLWAKEVPSRAKSIAAILKDG